MDADKIALTGIEKIDDTKEHEVRKMTVNEHRKIPLRKQINREHMLFFSIYVRISQVITDTIFNNSFAHN